MLPVTGHVCIKVVSSFLVKFLKVTMLNSTKLGPLKAVSIVKNVKCNINIEDDLIGFWLGIGTFKM